MTTDTETPQGAPQGQTLEPLWPDEDVYEIFHHKGFQDGLGNWFMNEFEIFHRMKYLRNEYEMERRDIYADRARTAAQLAEAQRRVAELTAEVVALKDEAIYQAISRKLEYEDLELAYDKLEAQLASAQAGEWSPVPSGWSKGDLWVDGDEIVVTYAEGDHYGHAATRPPDDIRLCRLVPAPPIVPPDHAQE